MSLALTGTVSLDGSGFEAGLHKLSHGVGHLSSELKGMALQAFGIYGVEQAIHKTVETAEELVTASKRMGMSVEGVQVFKQAAKESQTELAKVEGAFEKINVAREKALGGDAKTMGRFQHLGITEANLRSMNAADLFTGPLSNAAKTRSVEDLAPDLREVMGRGFGELLPVLKTDFGELGSKMKRMGDIMSTETAVSLKTLASEFSLISQILIKRFAPVLVSVVEIIVKAVGGLRATYEWLKERFTPDKGSTQRMTAQMNAMSGFGGPNPSQAEAAKKLDQVEREAQEDERERKEKGKKAAIESIKAFDEWFNEVKRKIAEDSYNLDHPPKPLFETEEEDEKTKMSHFKQGDSLVRVGNFLGGSKTALESIGETQVALTRQVVMNTANMVDRLSRLDAGAGFGTDIAVA